MSHSDAKYIAGLLRSVANGDEATAYMFLENMQFAPNERETWIRSLIRLAGMIGETHDMLTDKWDADHNQ